MSESCRPNTSTASDTVASEQKPNNIKPPGGVLCPEIVVVDDDDNYGGAQNNSGESLALSFRKARDKVIELEKEVCALNSHIYTLEN